MGNDERGEFDFRGEYRPKQFGTPSVEHQEIWKKVLAGIPQIPIDAIDKYMELLYAVERKFSNETRHETAFRYIREAEQHATDGGIAKKGEDE